MMLHRAVSFLLFVVLPPLAGCFSYHRAAGDALPAEQFPSDRWPIVGRSGLEEIAETPKVVQHHQVTEDLLPSEWRSMGEEGVRVMREIHSDEISCPN